MRKDFKQKRLINQAIRTNYINQTARAIKKKGTNLTREQFHELIGIIQKGEQNA